MKMHIDFRFAAKDDIPKLLSLFYNAIVELKIYSRQARADEILKWSPEKLAELIKNEPDSVFFALDGETPVGFCITEDQHGPIMLHWYGVDPNKEDKGIGTKIIKHLISHAKEKGATKIWCDTRTDNKASNKILDNFKFKNLCTLEKHWRNQDYYLWEYMLI